MWSFKIAALSLALPVLAGCGFEPVHAQRSGAPGPDDLTQVKIELIENRRGQELRNELLDRFNPDGKPSEPRYRLRVQLREADAPVAIDKDGTVSRSSLGIYAAYTLISVPDGKVVLQGTSTAFKGYGVITNSYATLVGKQDAERLTLRALADDITDRVSIYFHRQPTAQSGAAQ